jgi:hypothetical protein
MDAYMDPKLDPSLSLQTLIEVSHGIEDTQARAYGSLGIIFVSHWITKVHQKSIPKELGDMPIVSLDDFRTSRLIGTDNFPILFGIELGGQFRGVHEVTEHHRKLSPFGFWYVWCCW